MLVEEKKEMYEGFSPEYIRCYTNTPVVSGKVYNIIFKEKWQFIFKC